VAEVNKSETLEYFFKLKSTHNSYSKGREKKRKNEWDSTKQTNESFHFIQSSASAASKNEIYLQILVNNNENFLGFKTHPYSYSFLFFAYFEMLMMMLVEDHTTLKLLSTDAASLLHHL
jgi:hypothetical protein